MEKLILIHYVNAPKSSCEQYSDQLPEDDNILHFKDFFGKETHLTVSGQLEAELAATALGV